MFADDVLLSPWGTAATIVARRDASSPSHPLAELVERLQRGVSKFGLESTCVFLALELVQREPGLSAADQPVLLTLIVVSLVNQKQGSTRLPIVADAGQRLRAILATLLADEESTEDASSTAATADIDETFAAVLRILNDQRAASIIGTVGQIKPLLWDGSFLYHQRMLALENGLAERLNAILADRPPTMAGERVTSAIADVCLRPVVISGRPIELGDEQVAALSAALDRRVTVITGGPGTGKTTIVVSLLRVMSRLGLPAESIALAAPTGKAAYRLEESMRAGLLAIGNPAEADRRLDEFEKPRTLHRLLRYSPEADRFMHDENHRLPHAVVIVDEASMIDLHLMERLVRALRRDARLILLGDEDQLPSVEAGAVLRDLLAAADSGPLGAVRLAKSHRMDPKDPAGRNILAVAARINSGLAVAATDDGGDDAIAVRQSPGSLRFEKTELLVADRRSLEPFLECWRQRFIAPDRALARLRRSTFRHDGSSFDEESQANLRLLFAALDRARILCLTRVLATGAARINARLHDRHRAETKSSSDAEILPGEPILMLANDYSRGVFNGDQGIIVWVRGPRADRPAPRAVFPRENEFAVFSPASLRGRIELAYAMTVHKSQGSEFDHVAIVLPESSDLPINTREILYTALTRARRSVSIVGSLEVLQAGIHRRIERFTGIGEKLQCQTASLESRL